MYYKLLYVALVLPSLLVAPMATAQQSTPPPASIKGSEHPELIPDREAIGLFLIHVSDGPAALPWAARVTLLAPSKLTEEQVTMVINAANVYRAKAGRIALKVQALKKALPAKQASPSLQAQLDSLLKEQSADLDEVDNDLKTDLGMSAYSQFRKYIQENFKPTITYYPGKQ